MAVFEIWDKTIRAFVPCMGADARIKCNPKASRQSYQSATQYSPSVEVANTDLL